MKELDAALLTADNTLHGILYDIHYRPEVGEMMRVDVERFKVPCELVLVAKVTHVQHQDEKPYWYLVLSPVPEDACDEEFMEEISA